jgi:hypothetical protein
MHHRFSTVNSIDLLPSLTRNSHRLAFPVLAPLCKGVQQPNRQERSSMFNYMFIKSSVLDLSQQSNSLSPFAGDCVFVLAVQCGAWQHGVSVLHRRILQASVDKSELLCQDQGYCTRMRVSCYCYFRRTKKAEEEAPPRGCSGSNCSHARGRAWWWSWSATWYNGMPCIASCWNRIFSIYGLGSSVYGSS